MKRRRDLETDWQGRLASDWQVREFLRRYRRVAVVGLPADPRSDRVIEAERLLAYAFELYPVHSEVASFFGRQAYRHLHEIPGEVDIAWVLPEAPVSLLHLATDAVRKGVKVFWMEAAPIERDVAELLLGEGIAVVAERALEQEFSRLL